MITDALKFVTDRKWVVELILLGVVVAGVWWFCHHLIDVGVQRERAAWMLKVDKANLEAARLQGVADAAEAARVKEHGELEEYVRNNPLHGSIASLCKPPRVPASPEANASHVGTSPGTADVQPMSTGDSGSDEGEPDQLHMLSLLEMGGDKVSGILRQWQATAHQ